MAESNKGGMDPTISTKTNERHVSGALEDQEARRAARDGALPADKIPEAYELDLSKIKRGEVHYKPHEPNDPGPASKQPLRPEIIKLAQRITDRIGHRITANDPDYWGLAAFVTPEMAEVALKMKVRTPYTTEELVSLTGKPADQLVPLLQEMATRGLIEYNWEHPEGKKQWVLPIFVPGNAEFDVMNQRQLEEHPEIGTMFERETFLPLEKVTPMVPPGGAGIGMHVIPVERAIPNSSEAASVEKISHWLDKYDGRFSVGACSCRLSEAVRGDGCGDDPQDWCIGVGDMADYCVETGKGHYIDRDEVYHILDQAEKCGFVHEITNIDGEDKIFAICNCNVNVCYALRTSQLFNTPNLSRSAYVAEVDPDKCVACGGCVEVCPAGAPTLGQKLCHKDGSSVSYPVQPLPDELPWGKDRWSPDYKNKNRIETHESGTAPCKSACPAHVSIQGYLKMASEGRYQEALALIKQENPFPAVCGRVCNHPCEAACTRGSYDEALAIDDVKRFIADQDLDAQTRYLPEKHVPSMRGDFSQKIAIIGAGPAGLSCAFYLALKGYHPTVFDRNPLPGGMMVYGIPRYKLEKDVVAAEIDVLRELGVEIRCGVEVGSDVTLDELRQQGYEAFYLAIGCQGGRAAGIAGKQAPQVESAVDFLRRTIDDPDATLEGSCVVVGGGNVATDAAGTAARMGAAQVQLFCLEQRDEMPALPEEVAEIEGYGASVSCGWGPQRIELNEDGSVRGVTFMRCVRVYDDEHRFSPVYDEADTRFVPCDHVIMSIGQSMEWGSLLEGSKVTIGRGGRALADPVTFQTDEPDIFVGGDAYTGPSFVINAIAAGHEAAVSIHRFVQPGSSLTIGRNPRHYVGLDTDDVSLGGYDHARRQVPAGIQPTGDAQSLLHDWTDHRHDFTEEQIKAECARCLSCGKSVVDENRCLGCGLCTTRCEFGAIHLVRKHPEASTMIKAEDKMAAIAPYAAKRAVKIVRHALTRH